MTFAAAAAAAAALCDHCGCLCHKVCVCPCPAAAARRGRWGHDLGARRGGRGSCDRQLHRAARLVARRVGHPRARCGRRLHPPGRDGRVDLLGHDGLRGWVSGCQLWYLQRSWARTVCAIVHCVMPSLFQNFGEVDYR